MTLQQRYAEQPTQAALWTCPRALPARVAGPRRGLARRVGWAVAGLVFAVAVAVGGYYLMAFTLELARFLAVTRG